MYSDAGRKSLGLEMINRLKAQFGLVKPEKVPRKTERMTSEEIEQFALKHKEYVSKDTDYPHNYRSSDTVESYTLDVAGLQSNH